MRSFQRTSDVGRERIDLTDDKALREWAGQFGVDEGRLFAPDLSVGAEVEALEAYLADGGDLSSWEDEWDSVTPLETKGEWDIYIR